MARDNFYSQNEEPVILRRSTGHTSKSSLKLGQIGIEVDPTNSKVINAIRIPSNKVRIPWDEVPAIGGTDGRANWGKIVGELEEQEDLWEILSALQEAIDTDDDTLQDEIDALIQALADEIQARSDKDDEIDEELTHKQTKLTAGANIDMIPLPNGTVQISATGELSDTHWGNIAGDIYTQVDLQDEFIEVEEEIEDWVEAQDYATNTDLQTQVDILQAEIDAIDDDDTDFSAEIAALQDSLDTEIQDRKDADDALQDDIDTVAIDLANFEDEVADTYVPITDWAAVNAQIQDEIDAVDGRVTTVDGRVDVLGEDVSGLSADVVALEAVVANKQEKLVAGDNITLTPLENDTTLISASGGIDSIEWGDITGNIDDQDDLQEVLDAKISYLSLVDSDTAKWRIEDGDVYVDVDQGYDIHITSTLTTDGVVLRLERYGHTVVGNYYGVPTRDFLPSQTIFTFDDGFQQSAFEPGVYTSCCDTNGIPMARCTILRQTNNSTLSFFPQINADTTILGQFTYHVD
jgi:hypothetical protein